MNLEETKDLANYVWPGIIDNHKELINVLSDISMAIVGVNTALEAILDHIVDKYDNELLLQGNDLKNEV